MSSIVSAAPPYLFAEQGDHDSPSSYEIPGSLVVEPLTSTATFDGTGASGDFIACLTFRAQSGELLSRTFPATPVAAGDVAQISYAPFPGGIAPAPGGFTVERELLYGSPVSCNNNATVTLTWDGTNGPDSLVDFSTPAAPVYKKTGLYFVTFLIEPDASTPLVNGSFFVGSGDAVTGAIDGISGRSASAVATARLPTWNGTDYAESVGGDGPAATAGLFSGAAARSFFLAQASVMRLS